jgi:hypothetical protein
MSVGDRRVLHKPQLLYMQNAEEAFSFFLMKKKLLRTNYE